MTQQLKIDITVCAMSSDAENIADVSRWERFVQQFLSVDWITYSYILMRKYAPFVSACLTKPYED